MPVIQPVPNLYVGACGPCSVEDCRTTAHYAVSTEMLNAAGLRHFDLHILKHGEWRYTVVCEAHHREVVEKCP